MDRSSRMSSPGARSSPRGSARPRRARVVPSAGVLVRPILRRSRSPGSAARMEV
jgi:hypothetical protein